MTKPQIIYQDDRPAFVVVPYAEWLGMINRLMEGEAPIRVYREFHELTQEQLAEKAGVTKVYIGQLERGERNMSAKLRAKIAVILNVDSDDLTPWKPMEAGNGD